MSHLNMLGSLARRMAASLGYPRMGHSGRSRRRDRHERRRLGSICRLESLEKRELLAWNATFSAGVLNIQHAGTATTGVLKVVSGQIFLDGSNTGNFVNTGANLSTVLSPIRINASTTPDTHLIIDNSSGDFFNITSYTPSATNPTFVYDGGMIPNQGVTAGSNLTILGRASTNDLFNFSNPAVNPGSPLTIPPQLPSTAGTVDIFNVSGRMFLNYSNLNGELRLDGLGGADNLTFSGTAGPNTITVDTSTLKLQPFVIPQGGTPPGTQADGGNIRYFGFEDLAISTLGGNDVITLDDTSVSTLIDAGADDDRITLNGSISRPVDLSGGAGTLDRIIANGTSGDDIFYLDVDTVGLFFDRDGTQPIGSELTYTVGTIEAIELHGMAGDDVFTVQVPPRFQAPFPNELLPDLVQVLGDEPNTLSINHLRVLGNDPIANLTLGNDTIEVGDFGSGDLVEMSRIDSLVIYGLGGDDTIENTSVDDTNLGIPAVPSIIIGGPGDDTLEGGGGDDIIIGGPGEDTMDANEGDDYLFPDQDENGQIFNVEDETIDGGDDDDTVVRGIIDDLLAAQLGAPVDFDTISGFDDSSFERVFDIVDPFNPTSHLFQVTPALLALEEAFQTNIAIREFGPLKNLRKQFATYEAFVGRAYNDFLVGRQARNGVSLNEITFWSNLGQQGLPIEEMQANLLGSDEYRLTNRLTTTWVRAIFQDVLGRNPSNAEITRFAGPLLANDTREGRVAVALSFLRAGELTPTNPRTVAIQQMYQQFFPNNRQPSSADSQSILADLNAGIQLDELALVLFDSGGDYFNYVVNNNLAITGFVGGLYRDVLQRPGSLNEVLFWTNQIAAGAHSRESIATFFLTSTESRSKLIDSYYRTYLGRGSDAGGRNFWLGAYAQGARNEDVLAGIISSPEYFNRQGGTSDSFIRSLYSQLLQRPTAPAQTEVDFWIATLALSTRTAIPARADVVLGFQASDEYRDLLIDAYYQTYLGRGPTAGERATALNMFRLGATQEAVQVSLILSR